MKTKRNIKKSTYLRSQFLQVTYLLTDAVFDMKDTFQPMVSCLEEPNLTSLKHLKLCKAYLITPCV